MSIRTLPTTDLPGVEADIMSYLLAAAEPMTAAKIRAALPKRCRPTAEVLDALLESLVAQGRLTRFAPYRGKAPRYWDRSPEAYARQVILATLASKARSATDLEKALLKPLCDMPKSQRQAVVMQLAAERAIYALPSLSGGKSVRYSTTPPDPADYLRAAMGRFLKHEEKVCRQLAPLGIASHEVRQAARRLLAGDEDAAPAHRAPHPDSATAPGPPLTAKDADLASTAAAEQQRVIAKIRELGSDPRLGGFVSLPEVRRALQEHFAAKERFDQTVLGLAQARLVDLYPHDYPGSLSAEEQSQLVCDDCGNYFNGVSLRSAVSGAVEGSQKSSLAAH